MNPIAPPQVRVLVAMPKHFKSTDERHIAQYWRAREQIRNQWHRGFTKTLKKQFKKELATVTDAMKANPDDMEAAAKDAIEGGRKQWEKLYSGMYVGMAQDIAPMVLQQFEGETGKSFMAPARKDDLWMKFMLRYIKRAVPPKVDGLLTTSWDGVTSQIAEGVRNSESTLDIFKRIDSLYGDRFSTTRSMTIARTEVTAASNAATQQTGEYVADKYELDIVKKWITARDNSVRDSHQVMEGIEVDLDELFDVNGSSMLHPGDTSNGADLGETTNCRCDTVQHVRDT